MNCPVKFLDPTLMVWAEACPVIESAGMIAGRMRMSFLVQGA